MRWLAFLLLAAPAFAAQPLIVGVVPDLPRSGEGEEGIALGSMTAFDLTGYSISDGEDTYWLPPGFVLEAGESTWLVANGSLWSSFQGPKTRATDFTLRLGNGGDEVLLLSPDGTPVDVFAYGTGAAAGLDGEIRSTSPGLMYQRLRGEAGWVDTNTVADWQTPRPHRIGESALDAPTFDVTRLTLYASPDSSFAVLTDLIASARTRIHLHVYELRSMALVDALVAAKQANPTLDVQVLVDSSPVGLDAGDRHEVADALRRIQAVGGQSFLAGHGRYDFHHLKVLLVDDAVAVQSENWVPSGVPQDPSWGNRGWGAILHDQQAATWFATWMAADRSAWDTRPFELSSFDPNFEQPARLVARTGDHRLVGAKMMVGAFRVTPVIAPDHSQDPSSDPLTVLAGAAVHRLDVQQLDLDLYDANVLGWAGNDALAVALVQARDAGATVRVQVAQPFSADDVGNQEALDWLAARGVLGRELEDPDIATLHNKGFIADDRVVVGSINANHHSRSENREVSLILEGPGIADYFSRLFDSDWAGAPSGRDWSVPGGDLHALPMSPLPTLLALTGVAWTLRSRK